MPKQESTIDEIIKKFLAQKETDRLSRTTIRQAIIKILRENGNGGDLENNDILRLADNLLQIQNPDIVFTKNEVSSVFLQLVDEQIIRISSNNGVRLVQRKEDSLR